MDCKEIPTDCKEEINWADEADNEISNFEGVKFDEMGLKEPLLRGIYGYGFENPSTIQQQGIIPIIKGIDIIAQSQSGTGKTGTFTIGILQKIDESINFPQAIILTPTRELAYQINSVVQCMSIYMNIKSDAFIGGTRVWNNIKSIKNGVQIIVGTPGRIIDLIERLALRTDKIKILCLDEADEMLSHGFYEKVKNIVKSMTSKTQIILFSATLPRECLDITHHFMNNPVQILIKKEELTLMGINQFYVNCELDKYKFDVLKDLYQDFSIGQAVIFCKSKNMVDWLVDQFEKEDFTVGKTHGGISATERINIMKEFRTGGTRILVTTDLLSRGIDVQQVSMVINYDLPREKETYIHRIGRSGRFGRKGVAINLITPHNFRYLKAIERFYDTEIKPLPKNLQKLI